MTTNEPHGQEAEEEILLELESWRGYSAYELAVKHGFAGTEEAWLDSLKNRELTQITVNGIGVDENKDIALTAENILTQDGAQRTVRQRLEELVPKSDIENDASAGGETKVLSAEAGKELGLEIARRAQMTAVLVTLDTDGWVQQEDDAYQTTVNVTGVTADETRTSVIATPAPALENVESYGELGIRAVAQGSGTLTFCASAVPETDIYINVLVIDMGAAGANV